MFFTAENAESAEKQLLVMDYCIGSACRRRNDFQKADDQGENPFAKGFSPWTLFPKTPK